MTVNLFNGDAECCGAVTSGGSESLILAVDVYKRWGLKHKGITEPNIVAPESIHVGVEKGCYYMGVQLRKVSLDRNYRTSAAALEAAIDSNTVALFCSAPDFSLGRMDPITEIASLAASRGVGCHVDSCMGGFIIPFMREKGLKLKEEFDFKVPGVTSISADAHKYGNGPKGLSILMYRTFELRRFQFYQKNDWPGGLYMTTGLHGSRTATSSIGTWAVMMQWGRRGYAEQTWKCVTAARRIAKEISEIPEVELVLPIDEIITAVTITSKRFNAHYLSEALKEDGWRLLSVAKPRGVVFQTSLLTMKAIDSFIGDLKKAIAKIM